MFRFAHRAIIDIVFFGQATFMEKVTTIENDNFRFDWIWKEKELNEI